MPFLILQDASEGLTLVLNKCKTTPQLLVSKVSDIRVMHAVTGAQCVCSVPCRH